MMCVGVPVSKLYEHACPYKIVLVVSMKGCLQTNYGNVVKLIAVPSFTCMCVNFWLVHIHYIKHAPSTVL